MNNHLNPTNRKIITKVLCIDSLFRPNLTGTESTNFTYYLAEPINNVVSMKLSTVELPNNWYIFSARNFTSTFTITCYHIPIGPYTNISGGSVVTESTNVIVVPDGNYLHDVYRDALRNLFKNTRNGLEYIGVNVNEITSKVEFYTGTGNPDLDISSPISEYPLNPYRGSDTDFYFTIDFAIAGKPSFPLFKTIGWAMGFRKSFYEVKYGDFSRRIIDPAVGISLTTVIEYAAYLESESSFGSTYNHYVFLEIDDFQRNVSSNTFVSYNGNGDAYLNNNVLAKIVVTSGQYTNIVDTGADMIFKKRNYYGPVKLEKMTIKLLNRFGDVIDLNDNNYSFTLELEVVYS